MHQVLVNRLGGLSLPRKSVVRLTDRPDMTLDVYRGRKTTMQQLYTEFIYITPEVCLKCVEKKRHRRRVTGLTDSTSTSTRTIFSCFSITGTCSIKNLTTLIVIDNKGSEIFYATSACVFNDFCCLSNSLIRLDGCSG